MLDIKGLKTYYFTLSGPIRAVDDVDFWIEEGMSCGLAGESGCGKSTMALSIMRLLTPPGRVVGGEIILDREDILRMSEEEIRDVRWSKVSMIFQGAMNALNPVHKVGSQIVEAITNHKDVSKKEAWERARELLELVGIDGSRARDYPHEFSGGMKQRVMIAMALALEPKLLIADEPTTALDVVVQRQIINLLKSLKSKLGLSVLLISHDLGIMSEMSNTIGIMYAGKIVENAPTEAIFTSPLHPYTQGLLSSRPMLRGPITRLRSIPGLPPDLLQPPAGCRFHPRCPYAMEKCTKLEPELLEIEKGHYAACHLLEEG
ncbi:MAG: ABC transporter ATP-binding protein [Candidatus Bathyarchaeia archaeon]